METCKADFRDTVGISQKQQEIIRNNMTRISIIVPAYNEEGNVRPFYDAVVGVGDQLVDCDLELVYINDGSTDATQAEIEALVEQDQRVKMLCLSRNFGHQAALTAGMQKASGEAVITMDCDLQDPPNVIPLMIDKWRKGVRVVYARRRVRNDSGFKKFTADIYYRLLSKVSDIDIPRQVGDFRLMDRVVVDNLLCLCEHAQYLRGMVAWLGFSHEFVDFDRPNRTKGETHYTLGRMAKLAMDGLLSFSFSPLKIAMWIGVFSILLSLGFMGYMLYDYLVRGVVYRLFKWLTVVLFGFVGAQFILMWILGEYVGRIYSDVRKRPLYVISKESGFGSES